MSLPQRQDHLGARRGFISTSPSSTSQFAAITSRTGSPSPLSNSLIPRNYLGARQNSPKDKQTFGADVFDLGQHNKLNAEGAQQIDQPQKIASLEGLHGSSHENALQRQTTQSPPESPASSTFSTRSESQKHPDAMPRTSSIDSAISSISAASQPKSSIETKDASIVEIRNLIATAGSAENLVQHLLRDKQQAASQNAQLWRLVDKQRALLLGLNKDLERLTKEKERYKKKLKETHESALPAADTRPRKDSQSPLAASISKPVLSGQAIQVLESQRGSGRNGLLSTPDSKPRQVLDSSPIDPAMIPSPLHMAQNAREHKEAYDGTSQDIPLILEDDSFSTAAQIARPEGVSELSNSHDQLHSEMGEPEVEKPKPFLLMPAALGPPSFALIEPSPLNASPSTSFPPTRRAPPAPLQLDQAKSDALPEGASNLTEDSEVLVEDSSMPIDSPGSLRGRRKTREDDDRDREAVVLAEKEARSRSKKEKKPKSPVAEISEAELEPLVKPSFPNVGLPSSPRHPPAGLQASLSPPGSISGVLQRSASSGHEGILAPRPLSPGLPTSPRPTDRPPGSPMPRTARDTVAVNSSLPLSPRSVMSGMLSPRAPKQAIPLPASPRPNQQSHASLPQRGAIRDAGHQTHPMSPSGAPEVYQGFVSEEYPEFLLPPNALPSIQIKVTSSRLRPSRLSFIGARPQEDNSIFTLSVFSRSDGQELWRLEKIILALPQLDQRLRPLCKTIPSLPDRKLFNGHSPAIIDARRAALDGYFEELLDTEMTEDSAKLVCSFLSTDVIEPRDNAASGLGNTDVGDSTVSIGPDGRPRRTGYLTKRGKNFGGWKARYFVLETTELRYFESPGGAHLGTIKLHNAQIGRQSHNESSSQSIEEDNQFRHAFLILEPKRKDSASHVRHVLCAESDKERDEWVTTLLTSVDEISHTAADGVSVSQSMGARSVLSNLSTHSLERDVQNDDGQLRGVQYEETVAGTVPSQGIMLNAQRREPTPPANIHPVVNGQQNLNISGPINATVIAGSGQWGNRVAAPQAAKEKDPKKRGLLFGFKQKNFSDMLHSGHEQTQDHGQHQYNTGTKIAVRAVFGLPLVEAVELCPPIGVDVGLPAVVYRCIEYLREKRAATEEGLFRLSGSNVLIRALKERFNTEGDVDLLADEEYYDVHAVASLFKTYLRELPNPILTRELHLEFLKVLDVEDQAQKVATYNSLVQRLPLVNYNLLKTLAEYLLHVVNNADKNKMSIRNVGIVFSPTLNIPAPVFAIFLTDFAAVFEKQATQHGQHIHTQSVDSDELSAEDIRSPRRQMFQDLPTPAYNQSFSRDPNDRYSHVPASHSTAATGFIPVQQSYDSRNNALLSTAQQQQHPHLVQQSSQNAEYGSLNRMLAPENAISARAKRRESSMIFLG
jgi:RalA-binding protein 1